MKIWHLLGIILFALTCILIVNQVTGLTYEENGSYDIITGAFVETFILTVFFEFFNSRNQKKVQEHLQDHLRHVEKLIKENK
jgi:hypothetical protein